MIHSPAEAATPDGGPAPPPSIFALAGVLALGELVAASAFGIPDEAVPTRMAMTFAVAEAAFAFALGFLAFRSANRRWAFLTLLVPVSAFGLLKGAVATFVLGLGDSDASHVHGLAIAIAVLLDVIVFVTFVPVVSAALAARAESDTGAGLRARVRASAWLLFVASSVLASGRSNAVGAVGVGVALAWLLGAMRGASPVGRWRRVLAAPLFAAVGGTLVAAIPARLAYAPARYPPHALTSEFWMYEVRPFSEYAIPGVDLWAIPQGPRYVIGWDPAAGVVVRDRALFQRARGMTAAELATVFDDTIHHGACKPATAAKDAISPDGGAPTHLAPPRVEGGALVLFCTGRSPPERESEPLAPGMLAPR